MLHDAYTTPLDLSKTLKELEIDYPTDKDELTQEHINEKSKNKRDLNILEKESLASIVEGKAAYRRHICEGLIIDDEIN